MIIVGIAGPSGAGKTTLSHYLASTYKDEFEHLRQDDYRKHPDTFPLINGLRNWEHPDNLKFDVLYKHLKQLRNGVRVRGKTFAWMEGEQTYEYWVAPKPILLLDGNYILVNPDVSSMLDIKIYLDIPIEVSLERRKKRDGHRFQLDEFDRIITIPEYQRYGAVQKLYADFIVDGTQEPQTVVKQVREIIRNKISNNKP